jgi:hypothetical protein
VNRTKAATARVAHLERKRRFEGSGHAVEHQGGWLLVEGAASRVVHGACQAQHAGAANQGRLGRAVQLDGAHVFEVIEAELSDHGLVAEEATLAADQ